MTQEYPTSLGTSDADTITLLGQNLADDLMGKVGFGELTLWMVTQRRPTQSEVRVFESVLVALADHGFTPTAIAARITYLSAPDSVQGALAAGLLGGGSRFLGVTEDCGQFLDAVLAEAAEIPTDDAGFDALALAGGLLSDTAGDDATLVRADGTHVAIDLPKLFDGDPAMNLPVHDGDTVFVQRAAQFYVYGEVQHPGQYRLPRNTTISQAISIGGGLTPRGTQRGAIVKRLDADGKEHKLSVADEDMLQPNDVLLIKPSWF